MTKAGEQPTITQSDHEVIYLAPKCFGDERSWCEDAGVEDCDCIDGPHDWVKFTRASLAAQDGRCRHCDGTGDVHRADGEWLGKCDCMAAQDGLVEALERQTENMAFILNRMDLRTPWYEKFTNELREDRTVLSAIKGDKS